jgi:hypothetical protein
MSFGVPLRRRVAHTLPLDVCAVDHTAAGNWGVRCGFPTVADMKSDVGATRDRKGSKRAHTQKPMYAPAAVHYCLPTPSRVD